MLVESEPMKIWGDLLVLLVLNYGIFKRPCLAHRAVCIREQNSKKEIDSKGQIQKFILNVSTVE